MPTNDLRVRLDTDNITRFQKMADELKVPRDWLINHLLRSIDSLEITFNVNMKPDSSVQTADKTLLIRRKVPWPR
jgi:hypothetical protein